MKQLTQTRVPVAERYLDERNTRPKELSSIKLAGVRISHDLHYFTMILVLDMNIEIIPVESTTVKSRELPLRPQWRNFKGAVQL